MSGGACEINGEPVIFSGEEVKVDPKDVSDKDKIENLLQALAPFSIFGDALTIGNGKFQFFRDDEPTKPVSKMGNSVLPWGAFCNAMEVWDRYGSEHRSIGMRIKQDFARIKKEKHDHDFNLKVKGLVEENQMLKAFIKSKGLHLKQDEEN